MKNLIPAIINGSLAFIILELSSVSHKSPECCVIAICILLIIINSIIYGNSE